LYYLLVENKPMKTRGIKALEKGVLVVLILVMVALSSCFGGEMNKPLTPIVMSDGSGGVILVWGHGDRIWAQRLDAQGNTAWRTRLARSRTAYWHASDTVASDGHGGIIVTWTDWRNTKGGVIGCQDGRDSDVYAQRMSHEGKLLWGEDGIPVAIGPVDQSVTQVFSDGSGGAVIR
jgi:hypothetical protein